ncbi:class E sortase [Streptomyces sp. NPDC021093]|uniref:class E sortase n=1 Tax=Streptomyces sp. NPDC021093 TaxID=3365112 RepID=UPI0037BA988C
MTALRPEHDAADAPYEYEYDPQQQAYGVQQYGGQGDFGADALGAAVDRLADPLNDPLPGQEQPGRVREPYDPYDPYAGQQGAVQQPPYQEQQYGQTPYQYPQYSQAQAQYPEQQYEQPLQPQPLQPQPLQPQPLRPGPRPEEWYDPEGYRRDWYGPQQEQEPQQAQAPQQTYVQPGPQTYVRPEPYTYAPEQPADDETFALPTITQTPRRRRIVEPESEPQPQPDFDPDLGPGPASAPGPEPGGRAGRRRGARGSAPVRKDSTGVVVSRFVGELFITFGVVMLLFVTYQLWWTNVRAGMQADGARHSLQDGWAKGGAKPKAAGAFEPGQGFAIMHIPKLDVKVPVAEGIDKHKVLDRGMVGHYADGKLKTAMPADKQGNFAVAGHRNTHGEPFRYVNRLVKGDKIVVETQDAFYTYEMTSMLPQTSPANVSVIRPVPPGSGFTKPGRYLTLTTCTPEFTSTYRLIVWGKMVDERPRSKGMPAALDG